MHRVNPDRYWPLHDVARTRVIEQAAASALPSHTLMQRAGLAVARLAMAVAPHAHTIWVACGPGNNGGDGMLAAMHLKRWGKHPVVTWLGSPEHAPADAVAAHCEATQASVTFSEAPPDQYDLCIDALFGIGVSGSVTTRPANPRLTDWLAQIGRSDAPVLSVDLPSGLQADTGQASSDTVQARHTLSLLTLKPGLFTAHGRDACGELWFDDLGLCGSVPGLAPLSAKPGIPGIGEQPSAWLLGPASPSARPHASHKGSFGDVAVVGGAAGMTGAALLAATGALHAGAGRVFVALLDGGAMAVDPTQPELMFRDVNTLDLVQTAIVCGCGGGDAIRVHLAAILSTANRVVIDADAINSMADDAQLQRLLASRSDRLRATVLTPHPLEAARLLGISTVNVQHNRIAAAQQLCQRFRCTVVLKGSGTVIAAPGQTPAINPTGNARLATAGTGDVLAGMIGAELAIGQSAFAAACRAVYRHGLLADQWPATTTLTAHALARS